ncbi:MAG: amidase [Pseudomonadota bacterium]|jgi:Asp-tRNA(Asn)/Glu-tRNA(Gln) amidotransferase A subunit family amidase
MSALPPTDQPPLPAVQTLRRLARRELSAEALMRDHLDRATAREPSLHAFAARLAEADLLAQARALDAAGGWAGPLHGLPLGVKDIFDTVDLPTTYGSRLYAGHRPAADAASVALCRRAGALVAGKTVSTEFAYFHPGPTVNPHHSGHTPGGSSSGSAAAVGAGLLPLALGSQTAGSIIRPAAYCGVVGFKPSLGRVPRAGVKGLSDSLDTLGGFASNVADVALLAGVLCSDADLVDLAMEEDAAAATDGSGLRLGLCPTPWWEQADAEIRHTAWDLATRAFAPPWSAGLVDAVRLPAAWPDLVALQLAVMSHEMARSLAFDEGRHRDSLSERLRALIDQGRRISGAEHAAHLRTVLELRADCEAALFADCDILIAPSTQGAAPAGLAATGDPLFCRGWTLLGLPTLHVPMTRSPSTGLPIGLQFIGRPGADLEVLQAGIRCEARLRDLASTR